MTLGRQPYGRELDATAVLPFTTVQAPISPDGSTYILGFSGFTFVQWVETETRCSLFIIVVHSIRRFSLKRNVINEINTKSSVVKLNYIKQA